MYPAFLYAICIQDVLAFSFLYKHFCLLPFPYQKFSFFSVCLVYFFRSLENAFPALFPTAKAEKARYSVVYGYRITQ